MPSYTLKILNEKGLHARASAKLVEVVEGFDATAEISKDGLSRLWGFDYGAFNVGSVLSERLLRF